MIDQEVFSIILVGVGVLILIATIIYDHNYQRKCRRAIADGIRARGKIVIAGCYTEKAKEWRKAHGLS